MNSSSERLVVFVTPAQKRVLVARAARMGVSLSELVRRAVLAYDDTGPEVRAAGLVDRLAAASEAGRDDTLRRLVQAQAREPEPTARATLDTSLELERAALRDADAADISEAESTAALPVAAAVARALIAQAEAQAAQHDEQAQAETEALVARVVGSFPQGSV